jgi:hypothetical protein
MTASLIEAPVTCEKTNDLASPRPENPLAVARWQAVWLVIFWATFSSTLIAVIWLSLIPRRQTFETGAARHVQRLGSLAYEAQFAGRLPNVSAVGCGGFELTRAAAAEEVVRGSGRYWVDADRGIVRWSPRADTPRSEPSGQLPVATLVVGGRLEKPLGTKLLYFWIPAGILALAGALLAVGSSRPSIDPQPRRFEGLLARSQALFTWTAPGGRTGRVVLLTAVGLGLGCSLVPDWNRLVTCTDSRSYVENLPIRTPLTGWWIATFDAERNESRVDSLPAERRTVAHWGPAQRYVTAVRAWKLLFVASVCLFAWSLASIVPWWMVVSLILAGAAFDGSRGLWSTGMSGYLDVLLSEPLSASLLFFLLSSLCDYLARPSWTRGLLVVLCLNVLILGRPASLAFVAVLGCIGLVHLRRDGFACACRRVSGLAVVFLAGLAISSSVNFLEYGHFRQHAFTGMSLMTTALQVAQQDDAEGFSDPPFSEFARLSIAASLATRKTPFGPKAADTNCWRCAVPAFAQAYGVTAEEAPFEADNVLTRLGRVLVRRHPLEFLKLAAANFWNAFGRHWSAIVLVLTFAAAAWFYRRRGDWRLLYVACLALLPFLAILPTCLMCYPLERYQSLTSFAEVGSLPLLIGTLLSRPPRLSAFQTR